MAGVHEDRRLSLLDHAGAFHHVALESFVTVKDLTPHASRNLAEVDLSHRFLGRVRGAVAASDVAERRRRDHPGGEYSEVDDLDGFIGDTVPVTLHVLVLERGTQIGEVFGG